MMSRLVILMLFFYLFSSQPSPTEAAAPCDFIGISKCWNDILSKYCKDGTCDEDIDYCKDKDRLTECFQLNCELSDKPEFPFGSLFAGRCSEHLPTISEED